MATFHASLLTGLLERAADVEIVGTVPPAQLDREVPVPAFVCPDGVGRAEFYEDLLGRLRPDVVLMNHIAHATGVTHARLGSPVPAVGVVHSWHNITFKSDLEARERAMATTREAMAGLDAMIAPSNHAFGEGLGLGFRYPAIAGVIHNPLPPHYMAEDIDVNRSERRGVVYLGGLIPRKDPGALVEAAATSPTREVLLVGEGELEEELRSLIERRQIGNRVRLAGPLPGEDHLLRVRDLLLGAEVMCLPSRSESFGLVFAEALACGTPIVGFDPTVREIGDAMGIDVGEPIEEGTPEKIAAAIERTIAKSWNRRELRQATIEAFGLPRVTDRYLELFSRVCAPAGHAQP